MEENAFFLYLKRVPAGSQEALFQAYRSAQQVYASHGITTIQEGMAVGQMLPLLKGLAERNALYLDTVVYPSPEDWFAYKEALPLSAGGYDRRMKLGGLKIVLDGSPQNRTAWMRTPYLGQEPPYYGYGTMTDEAVEAALALAAAEGRQVLAHCNGDAAAEQYLRAVEKVSQKTPLAHLRPVMIHAQLLGRNQLLRVKALGILPSFFVAHVYHWGDTHLSNFGRERAEAISPCGSALALGIPFTFHQDTPVLPPDMTETLWCAVTRLTRKGICLGPEERIPPEAALAAVTWNGAWQYFEEADKGELRPGMRADLVQLDGDPLTVPPEKLRTLQVLRTVKDGETVYLA